VKKFTTIDLQPKKLLKSSLYLSMENIRTGAAGKIV
jgi:hypothetical protein